MSELSGKTKVAILLASLGPELAAKILGAMPEADVEAATLDVTSLGPVDADTRAAILEEFHQMMVANEYITTGGIDYARNLLETAFGPEKALDILGRLQNSLHEVPFQFLRKADPGQITSFLQDEHPQTISLILAHLDADVSALIISSLPQEIRSEVVMRIATMDRTPPEIVREVERVLERKMAAVFSQGFTFAGGVADVAEIMNRVERGTEKSIMSDLEERDPELAEEISRLMFTFDDLEFVDDAGIQKALREVEQKDLALALKTANDQVKDKVLRNMSERAREFLKEEIELMGPQRLRTIEEAQQKIVNVIRRLEEAGEVLIEGRGGAAEDQIIT